MQINPIPWWKHNIVLVLAGTLLGFLLCEIGIRGAEQRQLFLHGFENSVGGRGHWYRQGYRLTGELITQKLCADFFVMRPCVPKEPHERPDVPHE